MARKRKEVKYKFDTFGDKKQWTSNIKDFNKGFNRSIDRYFKDLNELKKELGNRIVNVTTSNPNTPVETGHLKQLISYKITGKYSINIIGLANYTRYQEEGTRYLRPRYFIRDSIQYTLSGIRKKLDKIVKKF